MRRRSSIDIWLLAGMILVALFTTATAGVHYAAPAFVGRLEIIEPQFNFGTRYAGEQVKHEFVLRNAGWSSLKLGPITTSCTCNVAEIPKTTLGPGETTTLAVTLSLRAPAAIERKSVSIKTLGDEPTEHICHVAGRVLPNYEVKNPATESVLPEISLTLSPETEAVTRDVRLITPEPVVIEGTEIIGNGISAEVITDGDRSVPRNEWLLRVTANRPVASPTLQLIVPRLNTNRSATLVIATTLKRQSQVRIPVTVRPPVETEKPVVPISEPTVPAGVTAN